MIKRFFVTALMTFVFLSLEMTSVNAQISAVQDAVKDLTKIAPPSLSSGSGTVPPPAAEPQKPLDVNQFFASSLLFSPAEVALVQKARGGKVEQPDETLRIEKKAEIPKKRFIRVSGVFFRKKGDWVVWINGKKVTPKALLPEIIEIDVEDSTYVHLKWYDIGFNKVISITIRPNQVYEIVTGILLPG